MTRRSAMVSVLIAMFFFSYFYRSSPAVIAPYLSREFSLGAERIGLLSSIFFYVFAAAQVPLGPALDSIGPRIVITALGTLAAIGSVIFATAPSFNICLLGRGLIGLGMCCMYMGTLTIVANWYAPRSFATVTGLVAALGNTGAFAATFPLALMAMSIGWRDSFLLVAAINLLLAAMIWLIVRDHPPRQIPASGQEKFEVRKAYRAILGNPSFWCISIVCFFASGSFLCIQGLWGGPFLMDVFGMTPAGAGSVLSLISIGYIIGSPLTGRISDRLGTSRKRLALIWLIFYLIPLILLCTFLRPGRASFLYPVYFFIGFFASGGVLYLTHLKELFPPRMVGTALTCTNFFAIGGVAVLQYTMGLIIERYPAVGRSYPLQAYRDAFLLLVAGTVLSILIYSRARESDPLKSPKKPSEK